MDKNLAGLERLQEEFHQVFNVQMEDMEEDIQIMKNNVNVMKIQMSSVEKDVKDVEMSIDNAHMCLEKVEDHVDGFVDQIHWVSQSASSGAHAMALEAQRVEQVLFLAIEGWSSKVERKHSIIDKKFVQMEEELDKVVGLVGQKINAKFGEFTSDFMESMEIEESHREALSTKGTELEVKLEHTLGHVACLTGLLTNAQTCIQELEDVVMEESNKDGEGEVVSSTSSDLDPVENVVAIAIPAPSIVHGTLIPIKVPGEFVPPPLHSIPSPPYIQAVEDDPLHSGVPEYWVNPEISS